ncbi:hypothetical protein GCM10009096_04810 [Parasphingorhabdus litoris]|uniref:Uncharacterized protein n=1 Tax=Parasphingorhabdus litoris TaxID=394733 RepID=A0ABP3JYV5_9SPHN
MRLIITFSNLYGFLFLTHLPEWQGQFGSIVQGKEVAIEKNIDRLDQLVSFYWRSE